MKSLLIAALSIALTACNTSTSLNLDYYHQDEHKHIVDDAQHCNDVGGQYELIDLGYKLEYRCIYNAPKHCTKVRCKTGAVDCPLVCQ